MNETKTQHARRMIAHDMTVSLGRVVENARALWPDMPPDELEELIVEVLHKIIVSNLTQ